MMIHQKYFGIGMALALAGLLNGCAVKMVDRSAISLALPQEWANAQSSTNLVAAKWWEGFASEELNGFVNEALAKNINLQVTASRLAQADLRQRIAGADRRPVLSASLDASKKRSNFIGLPIGGGSVLTSRSENYGFTLSSSWEADVWGRIRAGEIAAEMETAAAQSDLLAARQSLVAQTVKAWLQLTEAGEQIEIARANVSALETSVQQSNLRFNLGVGPALDLRLAETSLAISQATLEQWQSAQAQSRRQLETLLGRYPAGAVEGADQLPALPAGAELDRLRHASWGAG